MYAHIIKNGYQVKKQTKNKQNLNSAKDLLL